MLKDAYGLKNKREIWKADAEISRIRNLAKKAITKSNEEKELFVKRLHKQGFNVKEFVDILALNKEDWLKRRLQTIVFSKKLASTAKQARQLVSHKHVLVNKRVVNIPSYQVSLEEEPLISLNLVLKVKAPEKTKIEKIKEELLNEEVAEEAIEAEIAEEILEEPEEVIEEVIQ